MLGCLEVARTRGEAVAQGVHLRLEYKGMRKIECPFITAPRVLLPGPSEINRNDSGMCWRGMAA